MDSPAPIQANSRCPVRSDSIGLQSLSLFSVSLCYNTPKASCSMPTAVPLETLTQLAECGHAELVIPLLDAHLASGSEAVAALHLLGRCLRSCGRTDDAISAYQLLVLSDADPYDALVELTDLLRDREDLDDALTCADQALALDPERAPAHAAKASVLSALSRYEEALQCVLRSLKIDAGYAIGWYVLGCVYVYLGRHDSAFSAYTQALEASPDFHQARMERGLLAFLRGDLAAGFPDYEHRWLMPAAPPRRYETLTPWDGQPFDGTLLLTAEQGLGDEIFCCGFLPFLAQVQPKLVVEVDARLLGLMTRSLPDVLFFARTDVPQLPCPVARTSPLATVLQWLPAICQTATPPCFQPFLRATPCLQLTPVSRPSRRIGLFWRSYRKHLGASKSLALSDLHVLASLEGADFLSLQYGHTAEELEQFEVATGCSLHCLDADLFRDLEALAAAIASCDAIVAIPGVAAHLAGALGVPLYLLSVERRGRLWYWQNMAAERCWYPSARIFGGNGRSALPQVIQQVVHALQG